jgi:hypothetical protein
MLVILDHFTGESLGQQGIFSYFEPPENDVPAEINTWEEWATAAAKDLRRTLSLAG